MAKKQETLRNRQSRLYNTHHGKIRDKWLTIPGKRGAYCNFQVLDIYLKDGVILVHLKITKNRKNDLKDLSGNPVIVAGEVFLVPASQFGKSFQ